MAGVDHGRFRGLSSPGCGAPSDHHRGRGKGLAADTHGHGRDDGHGHGRDDGHDWGCGGHRGPPPAGAVGHRAGPEVHGRGRNAPKHAIDTARDHEDATTVNRAVEGVGASGAQDDGTCRVSINNNNTVIDESARKIIDAE